MAQRGKLAIAVAAGLAVIAMCFTHLPQREPMYQGLTMSQWLSSDSNQRDEALLVLGTNNLPLLINRVAYDHRKDLFAGIFRCAYELTGFNWTSEIASRRFERAEEASIGIARLGTNATSAIPQLAKIVDQGARFPSQRALCILPSLGEAGLAVLAAKTTSTNVLTRRLAAQLLGLPSASSTARSALTNLLNDPDPEVRRIASIGLSMPRWPPLPRPPVTE